MDKDNTYMLFNGTCSIETLPESVTNVSVPFYHSVTKETVKKHYYGELNKIKNLRDDVEREFYIVYNSIDKERDESTPFYKFIFLCIKTALIMTNDFIVKYAILLTKGIIISTLTLVYVPLLSFLKVLIELIDLIFRKDLSVFKKIEELAKVFKNNILTVLPSVMSFAWQFWQAISFHSSMSKLMKEAPNILKGRKLQDFDETIKSRDEKELKQKLNFGTNVKNLVVDTRRIFAIWKRATTGFNISDTIGVAFWGSISEISKTTIDTLKYFFNRAKKKIIGDGSSFIWSKFESIIDFIGEYVTDDDRIFNKKYEEHSKKVQSVVENARSRFEIANILVSYPLYIFNIVYSLIYWGVTFNMSFLGSLLNYLEEFVTSPLLFDLSLIHLVFVALVVLRLFGTCWNFVQYKACLVSVCDNLEETENIQLEQKACAEQCWNQGVNGISSLIVPTSLISMIAQHYGKEYGRLLLLHESLVKGCTLTLFLDTDEYIGNAIGFFVKGSENLNTRFDWNLF